MKTLLGILAALATLLPLSAGATEPAVARAQFTSAIVDREPADDLSSIGPGTEQVYFFTELRDMDGQTVTHRWSYNGEVKASVEFNIRGPRWRVYSSKNLLPEWTSDWTVDVLDGSGNVVATKTLANTAGAGGTTGGSTETTESTVSAESTDSPETAGATEGSTGATGN